MSERPVRTREPKLARESVSDEEMGRLLASFGNHEAKAVTLLSMNPGRIYSYGDLENRNKDIRDGNGKTNGSVLFNYCLVSLSPIGLVTKEFADPEKGIWGFQKTEKGITLGDPLAGLLLDFSLRHPDISLHRFFTHTNSPNPEKRAPILRLQILRALRDRSPMTTATLARKINEKDGTNVGRHLKGLSESGVITYHSSEHAKPLSYYQASGETLEAEQIPYARSKPLSSLLLNFLRENSARRFTREELLDRVVSERNLSINDAQKKSLGKDVGRELAKLIRERLVTREGFKDDPKSVVMLSGEQRELIVELLEIIEGFQRQDPSIIKKGKALAREIITDSDKVTLLLQKARDNSPNANALPKKEVEALILSLLTASQGLTSREIRDSLQNQGVRVSTTRVAQLTASLYRQDRLSMDVKKGQKHFSIAQSSS